jgi:hypothetical protein
MLLKNIRLLFIDIHLIAHHQHKVRRRFLDKIFELRPDAILLCRTAGNGRELNIGHGSGIGPGAEPAARLRHEAAAPENLIAIDAVVL